MKPKVILVFLLLVMLTSQAFSWWGRRRSRRRRAASSGSSPAGGPQMNRDAVVCTSYRSSNQLTCKKGRSSVSCTTVPTTERSDRNPEGPTPRGEYLIGKRHTHWKKNIDWYNLYPKKEDNSGYYGYTQKTGTGRSHMGLHPGGMSLGCVTVSDGSCWQRIRRVIDSGNMWYRGSGYSGFLYVK